MTKEEYYNLLRVTEEMKLDPKVYKNLKAHIMGKVEYRILNIYEAGTQDNYGLCKELMMLLFINDPSWTHGNSIGAIVSNLKLLEGVTILLRTGVSMIPPTFKEIEEGNLRHIYAKAIMPAMEEKYLQTVENSLIKIVNQLDKGYFTDIPVPFELDKAPDRDVNIYELYEMKSSECKTDRERLVYLLSCLATGIQHHAKTHGVTISSFKKLIKYDKFLLLKANSELDIDHAEDYIDGLMGNILAFATHAEKNPEPVKEVLTMRVPYHVVKTTTIPHLDDISPTYGLLIQLIDNRMFVNILGTDGNKEVNIMEIALYDVETIGYHNRTITNLRPYEYTDIGKILITNLTKMGMIDLFLQ